MKALTILSLVLIFATKTYAQKEMVFRPLVVPGDPNKPQPFTVHTAIYGAPHDVNVSGNVNDRGDFFYVYPVKDIDAIILARDKSILELKQQVADLQAAIVAIKKKVGLPLKARQ